MSGQAGVARDHDRRDFAATAGVSMLGTAIAVDYGRNEMGIFDKVNEMKDKADDLAEQAKEMAGKVPGGEGIADKIDDVTDQVDDLTDKLPE